MRLPHGDFARLLAPCWSERIAGCSDYRKPPGAWVLVRDDRRPGHAFFVGYDTVSRAKIGYIGRKGFRNALPPSDEWFDLGDAMLNWGSQVVASSNYVTFGSSRANFYVGATAGKDRLGPWVIFLKDGDTIQEVDLRDHRVRPVGEFETLLGVSVVARRVASGCEAIASPAPRVANRLPNRACETPRFSGRPALTSHKRTPRTKKPGRPVLIGPSRASLKGD